MKRLSLLILLITIILYGCSSEVKNEIENEKLQVKASTYPMYYVANEIGKDSIDLDMVVPVGVDPHEYDLSLKEITELEKSDLFIYNGLNLESWGEKVAQNLLSKNVDILRASDSVKALEIDEHDGEEDDDHGHHHDSEDPHIWLDPLNMDKIAYDVKEEFIKLDSDNKETYEKNYKELSEKLKQLDSKYKETLSNKKQNTILVSHEAFGYLANRYDLEQIAVTGISPQSEPSPKALAKLIDISKEENIKYIFFEVLANPKSVEMLAKEANLKTLTLNPLGGITQEQFKNNYDYIKIMEENLINLKKALVE